MSSAKGDLIAREKTEFLNNDTTIMLEHPFKVSKNDQIEITIEYMAGKPVSSAELYVYNRTKKIGSANRRSDDAVEAKSGQGMVEEYKMAA